MDVAVAVVWTGSSSSNWTPSLGTSIYCRCSPKKKKEKERKKERPREWWLCQRSGPQGKGKDQPPKVKMKVRFPPSLGTAKCDRLSLQSMERPEDENRGVFPQIWTQR